MASSVTTLIHEWAILTARRLNLRPDKPNTDENQSQREAADNPFAADSVREARTNLRAEQDSHGENCRTPNSMFEDTPRNVH
jgi:hypothetical protein